LPLIDLTNVLLQGGQISSIRLGQKENQKSSQRNKFVKIAPHVKLLLKTIFVARAVNRKKMYQELQERLNKDELKPEEVPRLSTVQNWITKTILVIKQRLSKQILEEVEIKI
ncbi:40960_t:CDS:2, partial [Gigaspora margarita]